MSFTNDHQVINGNRYNITAVNIGGFNADCQKPCFFVPHKFPNGVKGIGIDDIILISDTATTGSGATKQFKFQVKDITNTNDLLSSAIETATTEITADEAYRLTPDQNHNSLGGGTVLELDIDEVTTGGSPTDLSSAEVTLYVHWHWEV